MSRPPSGRRRVSDTAADWTRIEPILDDAMSALDESDRAAVLLGCFEYKSLREVGRMPGTSDAAAQKRVSRSIERLRNLLVQRGVSIGASGLMVVISTNAVQAAPVGLATVISPAAASAGTTIAATATATPAKAIAMTTLHKTLITGAIFGAIGIGIFQARHISNLRSEVISLERRQAPILEQSRELQRERGEAASRLLALTAENEQLKGNFGELARLRSEVGQLRQQKIELARLQVENHELRARPPEPHADATLPREVAPLEASMRDVCIHNLRMIAGAVEQCALENSLTVTNVVTTEQILPYLKDNLLPRCPSYGNYTFGSVTNVPTCSIAGHTMIQ